MPEEKKEEKKEDDDKIILQVDMHCEGCKAKVRKALKEFKGVEGLDVNLQDQKVTIKGKLDAKKVYETVKKKSGKRTVLLYPDLKKIAEDAEKNKAEEPKKAEAPPPDPEIVVVLKVNMHCGACAKQIRRSLLKMDGVTEVKADFANSTVTVKGKNIDPSKLCARVKKRSGKHCEIVPPPPPPPAPKEEEKKEEAKPAEEKKEEEKKEEEKKEEEKKEEDKKEEAKPAEDANKEEKPAEAAAPAEPEKKEEEKKEGAPEEKKEEKAEEKKEEKKEEEKKEEKKEEGAEETKTEVKKYEYTPYRSVPEYYVYPPQLFSDENPNACSIM